MRKYKNIVKDVEGKIAQLVNNHQRAYKYYEELFEKDYPHKIKRGKRINKYENEKLVFDSENYIFYDFSIWDIGAPVALSQKDYSVVEGICIKYCNFENCHIKNTIFRNCSFAGSKFKDVSFDGVVFEQCSFSAPVLENGRDVRDEVYYVSTIFDNCVFVGDFIACNMDYTLFKQVNLTLSKIQRTSLQHSAMDACAIINVQIEDCKLHDFSISNTDILDISFLDERLTTVDENTFLDYSIKSKRQDADKRNASGWIVNDYDDMCLKKSKTLRNFSKIFAENGYSDYEGEYFYHTKKIERKALHGFSKFKSTVVMVLCGYGERPSFALATILASIFLFAYMYMFSGVDAAGDIIQYHFSGSTPLVETLCDYGKCLFFSVTTFSTVGYGNYVPLNSLSMVVSGLHMIIGVSLCALWTGCIFRRITR